MRYAVQRAQFSESQGLRIVGVNPRVKQSKAFMALYEAMMDEARHMSRGGLVEVWWFTDHHCRVWEDYESCPDLTRHVYMIHWPEHPRSQFQTFRLLEAA